MANRKILVTGATGYIGGRLVPQLLDLGYSVLVLVRDPARLQGQEWVGKVEIIQGDMLKLATVGAATDGISAAYYMIHSMGESDKFHDRDLIGARNFGEAAKKLLLNRSYTSVVWTTHKRIYLNIWHHDRPVACR